MAVASDALNSPKRLKRLLIQGILDTPPEEAFDRFTRLATDALDVPIALLTFVDDRRQWFKSSEGLPEPWKSRRETPLSHSLCRIVVEQGRIVDVPDADTDPRVRDHPAWQEFSIRAYLGAPLIDRDGSILGSFAAIDRDPRVWTQRDRQVLADLAAIAMLEVNLRSETAQRLAAERELQQARKLESLGRLAGGVAHDFNNAMLIINGFVSLLSHEVPASTDCSAHLEEIAKAARRASDMTRQLLAVGRQQPLAPRQIYVNEVLRNLAPTLEHLLGESIELTMDLYEAPLSVYFDRLQLEQLIINLALNARDAMPSGGRLIVRTEISRHETGDGSADSVEITVSDTGCGMDTETLDRAFEPFFTTKPFGKGSGLGLATVHGAVEQGHGRIWAESKPGQGSTFHVRLPATTSAAQAPSHAPAEAAAAGEKA